LNKLNLFGLKLTSIFTRLYSPTWVWWIHYHRIFISGSKSFRNDKKLSCRGETARASCHWL